LKRREILLVGAGGHARSCIDVIEQGNLYKVAGLIGTIEEVGNEVLGYKVLGSDVDLPGLSKYFSRALVVVGQVHISDLRQKLFYQLSQLGFVCPPIISPFAYVSRHAEIGDGSIVMHRAIVNASARIGTNCIINSCALIEHDVVIGNDSHVGTCATVNGSTRVGRGTLIGSSSTIRESIQIGDRCIVGMGTTLRHNLADDVRFIGDK
jgi:sugar O-acyltransferase (sialic acid O-acetyltransferase NeuD family)